MFYVDPGPFCPDVVEGENQCLLKTPPSKYEANCPSFRHPAQGWKCHSGTDVLGIQSAAAALIMGTSAQLETVPLGQLVTLGPYWAPEGLEATDTEMPPPSTKTIWQAFAKRADVGLSVSSHHVVGTPSTIWEAWGLDFFNENVVRNNRKRWRGPCSLSRTWIKRVLLGSWPSHR